MISRNAAWSALVDPLHVQAALAVGVRPEAVEEIRVRLQLAGQIEHRLRLTGCETDRGDVTLAARLVFVVPRPEPGRCWGAPHRRRFARDLAHHRDQQARVALPLLVTDRVEEGPDVPSRHAAQDRTEAGAGSRAGAAREQVAPGRASGPPGDLP